MLSLNLDPMEMISGSRIRENLSYEGLAATYIYIKHHYNWVLPTLTESYGLCFWSLQPLNEIMISQPSGRLI